MCAGAVAGIVQARRRLAWQRALKELLVARAAKMRGPSQGVTASRLEDQMADAVEAEIVANRAYNAAEDRVAAIKAHHDELTEASLEERSGKAGV